MIATCTQRRRRLVLSCCYEGLWSSQPMIRWLSSSSSSLLSALSRHKAFSKRTSLIQRQHSKPKTLKDRLRSRSNNTIHKALTLRNNEELMAERLMTRVDWARQAFYSSTEWMRPSPMTISTTTTINGQAQSQPKTVVLRYETPMDSNWWFWNLLLAATPSLFIAGYCEFVARPQMNRHQQRIMATEMALQQPTTTTTPAATLSLSEAWTLLVSWIQGREKMDRNISTDDATSGGTPPLVSSTSSLPTDSQQHLIAKLHEFQQQIQVLEQEIRSGVQPQPQQQSPNNYNNDHHANPTSTPQPQSHSETVAAATTTATTIRIQSPLQQRHHERERRSTSSTTDTSSSNNTNKEIDKQHPQQDRQPHQQHQDRVNSPSSTSSEVSSTSSDDEKNEDRLSLKPYGVWQAMTSAWKWTTPRIKSTTVTSHPIPPKEDTME